MLTLTPNCLFHIHRGFNAAAPYTLGAEAYPGNHLKGFILPRAHNGRYGSQIDAAQARFKFTHLILCDDKAPGGGFLDIRDAYNTEQAGTAFSAANADTIIIHDTKIQARRTAYYVVFVERIGKGKPWEHLRIFLDRCRPESYPTDSNG